MRFNQDVAITRTLSSEEASREAIQTGENNLPKKGIRKVGHSGQEKEDFREVVIAVQCSQALASGGRQPPD